MAMGTGASKRTLGRMGGKAAGLSQSRRIKARRQEIIVRTTDVVEHGAG